MLDQTHVMVIYLIGSFSGKIGRRVSHHQLIDTDYQIGFPVDKARSCETVTTVMRLRNSSRIA